MKVSLKKNSLQSRHALERLRVCCRHCHKLAAVTIALLWLIIIDLRISTYGATPNPHHPAANPMVLALAFVVFTGLMQPLLPCLILLLTCNGQVKGFMNPVASLLSAKWLSRLANMSFDIYLLHPIVILCIWSIYPPSTWLESPDMRSFVALVAVVLITTSCVASLHKRIVTSMVSCLVGLNNLF